MDLQHFPNREHRTHGLFEKEIDHTESRHEVRRAKIIAQMFDGR